MDEITFGELARLIERNHLETREDFASVHQRLDREWGQATARLDQTVQLNVYQSDQRGTDARFARLENDMAAWKATARWSIGLAISSALTAVGLLVSALSA